MNRRRIYGLLVGVLIGGATMVAEETNLLSNGSFENYKTSSFLGVPAVEFTDWGWDAGTNCLSVEEADVFDGNAALRANPQRIGHLDQSVPLSDDDYAVGSTFELTIHYQVLSLPEGGNLSIGCFWEAASGGSSEAAQAHDAEELQRVITEELTTGWQTLKVVTTKPSKTKSLYVRMTVCKNSEVLFDDFSLTYKPSTEPYINVSPQSLPTFSANLGESVTKSVHIRQGNLSNKTTFELSYTNADQFAISASELAADQSELDLIITYAPTQAGNHTAVLNIMNEAHSSLFQSIRLNGSCTDPSAQPELSVTPSELEAFEVLVGREQTRTITVTSLNCTDYVHLQVDHVQGAAFTVVGSMLPKNGSSEVTVRFHPIEEGEYESTLTVYSQGAASVVIRLQGKGVAQTPETIDWATSFEWDDSAPLSYLYETFDDVTHNETLFADGWQNVAAADARPWWGFDASQSSAVDGEGTFAKATAYQSGKASTGEWEMWLVTPALDYKNAAVQIFGFSVMGLYLPEEGNEAKFEVYYIDASDPTNVFFQAFDGLSIPTTSDENETWVPFQIHLENQPNIADVFHMAFRYTAPNGAAGVVTYFVDDVSWGRAEEGLEQVQRDNVPCTKVLRGGQLMIIRDGSTYDVLGIRRK